MKIAIDAMGGDNAPQAVVEGCLRAAKEFTDTEFILYGDVNQVEPLLSNSLDNISLVHTDQKIEADDEPVKAIRKKKDASMVLAARAVKEGRADALVSAGNTGALLASGLLVIGRIKGVDRPGLMATLPAFSGPTSSFLLNDAGANADTKPINMLQFAILSSVYAEKVLKKSQPRVGLLNNGSEASKGSELTKKAYGLLENEKHINFIGNVESRDLLEGVADVVVADGFTGNAVLKAIEGTASSVTKLLKKTIMEGSMKTKLGGLLIKDGLGQLKEAASVSSAGGAILLGIKAPVMKTHGSADGEAIYYTLKQSREILISGAIDTMTELIESLEVEED